LAARVKAPASSYIDGASYIKALHAALPIYRYRGAYYIKKYLLESLILIKKV